MKLIKEASTETNDYSDFLARLERGINNHVKEGIYFDGDVVVYIEDVTPDSKTPIYNVKISVNGGNRFIHVGYCSDWFEASKLITTFISGYNECILVINKEV